jgi:hypothetical protein
MFLEDYRCRRRSSFLNIKETSRARDESPKARRRLHSMIDNDNDADDSVDDFQRGTSIVDVCVVVVTRGILIQVECSKKSVML